MSYKNKDCQHDYINQIIKKQIKLNGNNVEISYCHKCNEEIGCKLISKGDKK